MTASASNGVDPGLGVDSIHTLIQLALCAPLTAATIDWPALCALAEHERVLGITWKASGERIATAAPANIASRWRRKALLLGVNASEQLELLTQAVRVLMPRGVGVVVLKGLPLAQRLYNDCTVRPLRDIDLYVPLEQRPIASAALTELGWRCTGGRPPEEETFEVAGTRSYRLEVHSSALDDPLLDHVQFPVERIDIRVGDALLPAHGGRFLPAYLSAHLAKHREKPLLWAIDFLMLWSGLDTREQSEALEAARECGLSRHLRWAISVADGIAAAGGKSPATNLTQACITNELASHGDAARLLQLVSLSESPRDALQVVAGRIWPAAWRSGWRDAPAYFAGRAVRWYRRAISTPPRGKSAGLSASSPTRKAATSFNPKSSVSVELPKRSLTLSASEIRCLIRETVEAGGEIWVGAFGQSMHATVRHADQVLLSPLGQEVRPGDIVLVPLGHGFMLHRVVHVSADAITTRGDARRTNDPTVGHGDVLARAVAVRRKGKVTPLVLTHRFGVAPLLRFFIMETRRRTRLTRAVLWDRLRSRSRQIA